MATRASCFAEPVVLHIRRVEAALDRKEPGLSPNRRERFERLFEAHYRRVLAYAMRRTDLEEARDVASEVFLIAWKRLELIPEEPMPWLIATARNLLRRSRRSRSRRQALEHRIAMEPMEDETAFCAHGSDRGFTEAFASLSERDREVLTLVSWDQLDATEAAESLGVSVNAFNVRLHRARRRLRVALEQQQTAQAKGER